MSELTNGPTPPPPSWLDTEGADEFNAGWMNDPELPPRRPAPAPARTGYTLPALTAQGRGARFREFLGQVWRNERPLGTVFGVGGKMLAGAVGVDLAGADMAVQRGAAKALNEASDVTVAVGRGIMAETGAYRLVSGAQGERDFLDWYSRELDAVNNPLRVPTPAGRMEGFHGFLEVASQFATGMAATGGLKIPGTSGGGRLAGAVATAGRGAVVDAGMMDAREERLSNLIEAGPEWIRNPLTRFLQADPDDNEAEARAKAALEGVLTGLGISGVLKGVKSVRLLRQVRSGALDPVEAEARLAALDAEQVAAGADEAFEVAEDAGGIVVRPRAAIPAESSRRVPARKPSRGRGRGAAGAEAAGGADDAIPAVVDSSPIVLRVESAGEAERMAASLNDAARASARPLARPDSFTGLVEAPPAGTVLTEQQRGQILTVAERIRSGVDPADAEALQDGIDFNFARSLAPADAKAVINATSEVLAGALRGADDLPAVQTWKDTARLAENLIPGLDGPRAAARIQKLFGDTRHAPEEVLATRTTMYALAKEASRLARLADLDPENPVAAAELAKTLDSLAEIHGWLKGTSRNVARTLNAHAIPVDGAIKGADDGGRITARGGIAQQAPTSEGEVVAGTPPRSSFLRLSEASGPGALRRFGPDAARNGPAGALADAGAAGRGAAGGTVSEAAGGALSGASVASDDPAADAAARLVADTEAAPVQAGAPAVYRLTEGMSVQQMKALARALTLSGADPERVLDLLTNARVVADTAADGEARAAAPGLLDRLHSYRVNAMLSGPKTHAVNFTNNLYAAFAIPAENWWGGVRSGIPALRQEGADVLVGLMLNWTDALRAARRAWQQGGNILDPSHVVNETVPASVRATGMGWLETAVNLPSRALLTSDEMFKTLTYRANVRALSLRAAREEGITDPAAVARRLVEDMEAAFAPDGSALNERALRAAREATFTEDLRPGSFAAKVQAAAQDHFAVRFVLPFIRTPVNVFRFAWQRTPGLARFEQATAEALAAGGEDAARARARQEIGGAIYGVAAGLALSGMLTGRGPIDPKLNQQWRAAGNQPYSVRIGGVQVDYGRLEPFATFFGMVADAAGMLGEMGEEDAGDVALALAAAFTRNVSSKTFLRGAAEFLDTIASGDPRKVERFVSSALGSFVPNVGKQLDPDDLFREARSIMEGVQARVPGWSADLEPRRNIFGEPVAKPPNYANRALNPFTTMQAPDTVSDELIQLGRALPMPAERIGRVDLTDRTAWGEDGNRQSPYDRLLELLAAPEGGGTPLREEITALAASGDWETMGAGTELHPGGRRYQRVSGIVSRAHARAFRQVEREYPKLREALQEQKRMKADALRGFGPTDVEGDGSGAARAGAWALLDAVSGR